MFRRLLDAVVPFSQIAAELRILRELYEMDLASRHPPLVRVTEPAGRSDTEVTYMGEPSRSAVQKLLDQWEQEEPETETE